MKSITNTETHQISGGQTLVQNIDHASEYGTLHYPPLGALLGALCALVQETPVVTFPGGVRVNKAIAPIYGALIGGTAGWLIGIGRGIIEGTYKTIVQ